MSRIDISTTMQHSKTTKGTEVYTSAEEGAPVTTIYIKKTATPSDPPKTIKLTIIDVE